MIREREVTGTLILCRVMSLVPMRLKSLGRAIYLNLISDLLRNIMWDSDVDFDLAAFHALVRALKRTLRQLVEGALAHVLLQVRDKLRSTWSVEDLNKVKILPKGFMSASPMKDPGPLSRP